MSTPSGTELSARLDELQITPAELASIVRVRLGTVEEWLSGEMEPSPESRVLLRVLDDDHVATLAVEHIRHHRVLPLRKSVDPYLEGVEPSYGTDDTEKTTGGQPK